MARQLLIYKNVKPLSKKVHRTWSVQMGDCYQFARNINRVPITAIEFPSIAREYAIVFIGNENTAVPVALMGVRDDENLYISSDNKITAKYIPAFLRRYPFVFATVNNGDALTLCIDESFDGCNQNNVGEKLFEEDGEHTPYLRSKLKFLNEYQAHFNVTKEFCRKLIEFELLEPMNAQIKLADGKVILLKGFSTVNRDKLKSLSPDRLQSIVTTDELELIYLHLHSLRNLDMIAEMMENGIAERIEAVAG